MIANIELFVNRWRMILKKHALCYAWLGVFVSMVVVYTLHR